MDNRGALTPGTVWGEYSVDPDSWSLPTGRAGVGGVEYGSMIEAFRTLQDRVSGAALTTELETRMILRIGELNDLLAEYQVPEEERFDGQRPDLPGRGSTFVPPYVLTEIGDDFVRGHVTFRRFHLGGNSAAHGGAHPLMFDDVLGKLVNYRQQRVARTASLRIDYRRVTPLNAVLTLDARVEWIEGRKRLATGRLADHSGAILAEAEGLFVELLGGQS